MKKRILSNQEKKLIEEYSEGNSYLSDTLTACWENNIRTFACCAGHKDEHSTPYLGILIDDESAPAIKRIIGKLQDMKDISMITSIRQHGEEAVVLPDSECRAFVISGNNSNRCEMFYKISQAIESQAEVQLDEYKIYSTKKLYDNVENILHTDYQAIVQFVLEDIIITSGWNNHSTELIEYKGAANNLLGKITRMPIVRKILEGFSPKIRKNHERYDYLENKYGNMQNSYAEPLNERLKFSPQESLPLENDTKISKANEKNKERY